MTERGARHVNANVLRYFTEPTTLDAEARSSLRLSLRRAKAWAVEDVVVPRISKVIGCTVSEINAELHDMKIGKGPVGKAAVASAVDQPGSIYAVLFTAHSWAASDADPHR